MGQTASNNQPLVEGKLLYFTVISLCLTSISSSKSELALMDLALGDTEAANMGGADSHLGCFLQPSFILVLRTEHPPAAGAHTPGLVHVKGVQSVQSNTIT